MLIISINHILTFYGYELYQTSFQIKYAMYRKCNVCYAKRITVVNKRP